MLLIHTYRLSENAFWRLPRFFLLQLVHGDISPLHQIFREFVLTGIQNRNKKA